MKYGTGVLLGAFFTVLFLSQANVGAAGLNDFRISSFEIDYTLSRDSDGNSKLKTNERIEALFSSDPVNRGIERAIPVQYNSRTLPLTINSVTDADGKSHHYTERDSKYEKVLRIGSPVGYATGLNVYNIDYTQQHVTRYYEDTKKTEWYWNTNGTGWRVPIDKLSISIKVDDEVIGSLRGEPQCYIGVAGSRDRCDISAVGKGQYSVEAEGLERGENVTVAFGFSMGTFKKYEPPFSEKLFDFWTKSLAVTSILGFATIIFLVVQYNNRSNRRSELQPIAVEYIPPSNTSVTVSADVLKSKSRTTSLFSAQLIDLAVRRYIKVIEKDSGFMSLSKDYDIEIAKSISPLLNEEKEILLDMFYSHPTVGEKVSLRSLRTDGSYFRRVSDNRKKLNELTVYKYGIRTKDKKVTAYFRKWSIWLFVIGVLCLSPTVIVSAIFALAMSFVISPLTDKGVSLKRYLLGFEQYIKAAEKERLAFLQGPDTAEKIGEAIDVNDMGQVVKLYERALPYAILFGHEKKWSKEIGDFYAQTNESPDWYVGRGVFNAAVFHSSLVSFSKAASYSSGTSGSGSGGSGGGGFSGGGGGGGGGGGW